MNRTWDANNLILILFAYIIAAGAGPMIYASSQVVLEHLHPTSVIPETYVRPAMPGSMPMPDLPNFHPPNVVQRPERDMILLCANLQNNASRLHCYDSIAQEKGVGTSTNGGSKFLHPFPPLGVE